MIGRSNCDATGDGKDGDEFCSTTRKLKSESVEVSTAAPDLPHLGCREGLDGAKSPVEGGFNRKIEVNANSCSESERKVEAAGHKIGQYRFGGERWGLRPSPFGRASGGENVMNVRDWVEQQVEIAVSGEDDILRQRMHIVNVLSPTITKLMEAARNFAARVEERNPEWFREERGTTDFSEADHALRAALAELEKP